MSDPRYTYLGPFCIFSLANNPRKHAFVEYNVKTYIDPFFLGLNQFHRTKRSLSEDTFVSPKKSQQRGHLGFLCPMQCACVIYCSNALRALCHANRTRSSRCLQTRIDAESKQGNQAEERTEKKMQVAVSLLPR